MAYSFSGRVRYSEIGENGLLTLPGILNYFQDCSTFQSEEVGLGIDIFEGMETYLGIVGMAGGCRSLSIYGRTNQNIYLGIWIPWIYGTA